MEWERRYIVVKRKHLTQEQEGKLLDLLNEFQVVEPECLVVETDWPEFNLAANAIEKRTNQT